MSVVDLQNVRYRWDGQSEDTLDIESLKVSEGEHVFVRGVSGSGKTTLLNVLAGILIPQSGEVSVLGQSMQALSQSKRDTFRADHMGVIFQQFNLLPYLSVTENVILPCQFSKVRNKKAGDVTKTAKHLLDVLGLKGEMQNKPVANLSVGQQQRVAVARALIGGPELIIADEPTSALDTETRDDFLSLLFSEAKEQGSTILFVSHDPYIAKHFPKVVDLHEINRASKSTKGELA